MSKATVFIFDSAVKVVFTTPLIAELEGFTVKFSS